MPASRLIAGIGKITSGIAPNQSVDQTIGFVEERLHLWRDDASRPAVKDEGSLNAQLCKYLNDRARDEFPMACFHHEEKQGKHRRVDISVNPSSKGIKATTYQSIYEPYLVIEGKRLPAPTNDRRREYLTGLKDKSGGIQRFRLCLHGGNHTTAVIVGYVQEGEVSDWLVRINGWITELKDSGEDNTCEWADSDQLVAIALDGKSKASRCESQHLRNGSAGLRLIHLWICIPTARKARPRIRSSA